MNLNISVLNLTSNLTYDKHVNEVIKLSAHKAYMLGKVRKFISKKQALLIFKSRVYPTWIMVT